MHTYWVIETMNKANYLKTWLKLFDHRLMDGTMIIAPMYYWQTKTSSHIRIEIQQSIEKNLRN